MRKYCVDCKYHEMGGLENVLHLCSYGDRRDMVTGEKAYRLCSIERYDQRGGCSRLGRNWEKKNE